MSEEDTKPVDKRLPTINLIRFYQSKIQFDRTWLDPSTFCLIKDTIKDLEELELFRKLLPKKKEAATPRIVCLIGSASKAAIAFREEYDRLSAEGAIVLTISKLIPVPGQPDEIQQWLHLRKIDLADEVHVLNVNGYIGQTTREELAYAESRGKIIEYLEKSKK